MENLALIGTIHHTNFQITSLNPKEVSKPQFNLTKTASVLHLSDIDVKQQIQNCNQSFLGQRLVHINLVSSTETEWQNQKKKHPMLLVV